MEFPKIINSLIPSLQEIIILYIFDEIENVSIYIQQYLQTLIREKSTKTSFKLSGRLYGLKTTETFCSGESNIKGSEYELIELDEKLRALRDEKFENFSRRLILSRIKNNNIKDINDISQLDDYFEKPTYPSKREEDLITSSEWDSNSRKHITDLEQNLKKIKINDKKIAEIIKLISCKDYPFIEKVNTFLFYHAWQDMKDNLVEQFIIEAKKIQKDCLDYIKNDNYKDTMHYKKLKYFRTDLIAQFYRESIKNREKYKVSLYSGIKNFITMSGCIPRVLLQILKYTYDESNSFEEHPFQKNTKISLQAQRKGIIKASHWFFEDAILCENREYLYNGITNLAIFFRDMRYSNKPAECSCCSFSFNPLKITTKAFEIIEEARNRSLFFKIIDGRKDKNSLRVDLMFQLNPMLSPIWDLPIARRGTIQLSPALINAMF